MDEKLVSGILPVLALRGLAVFPDQTVHFDIGRPQSLKALETAMKGDQHLMLVPQKDLTDDAPGFSGLYPIGTVVKVKQVLRSQGENLRVLVSGICRARVIEKEQEEPYLSGLVEAIVEQATPDNARNHALCREANMLYGVYCEMAEQQAQAVQMRMMASKSVGFIADAIAQNSSIDYADKAKLLCQLNPVRRMEQTLRLLHREVDMLQLDGEIQEKTHANIDQNQKDYYLREQMRVIREELGEGDDAEEADDYRK